MEVPLHRRRRVSGGASLGPANHNRKNGSPHVIVCSDGAPLMFLSHNNEWTVASGLTRALIKGLMNVRRREISVHVDESNNDVL
jgi:hypothetical protein